MKNKLVSLHMYNGADEEDPVYKGRLLGLITEEEFRKIISSRDLQTKIETGVTVPLTDVAKHSDLDGMRMVLSLRKKDETTVLKRLFISEKLGMVTCYKPDSSEISVTGEKGAWFTIKEIAE